MCARQVSGNPRIVADLPGGFRDLASRLVIHLELRLYAAPGHLGHWRFDDHPGGPDRSVAVSLDRNGGTGDDLDA